MAINMPCEVLISVKKLRDAYQDNVDYHRFCSECPDYYPDDIMIEGHQFIPQYIKYVIEMAEQNGFTDTDVLRFVWRDDATKTESNKEDCSTD